MTKSRVNSAETQYLQQRGIYRSTTTKNNLVVQKMAVKLSDELNDQNMLRLARHIIRMVFKLTKYYYAANPDVKEIIMKNLSDSYRYECKMHNKLVPIERYVLNTEKSIGWDWVLPDE